MANDQQATATPDVSDSDDKTVSPPNETNENTEKPNVRPDGKRELTEDEAYEILAYNWPTWKKWMYLSSVALIQIAMNYNTSVYPNAVTPLVEEFGISQQGARTGQMIYLVFYSFGCELWAPWSEEFGRWPILQLSETLINIFILPAALANSFSGILAGRALVCLIGYASDASRTNRINRAVSPPLVAVSHLVSSQTCTNRKTSSGLLLSSFLHPASALVSVV